MEARFETLDELGSKRFYLQYRFPPSSVGEVGRVGGVNRREVWPNCSCMYICMHVCIYFVYSNGVVIFSYQHVMWIPICLKGWTRQSGGFGNKNKRLNKNFLHQLNMYICMFVCVCQSVRCCRAFPRPMNSRTPSEQSPSSPRVAAAPVWQPYVPAVWLCWTQVLFVRIYIWFKYVQLLKVCMHAFMCIFVIFSS